MTLDWSIAALTDAYIKRITSPVEVMKTLLDAIADDPHQINALCYIDEAASLSAARAAEARWHAGAPASGLDGIPVSIKDMTNVAGWPTRRGSRACADDPPAAEDAPAVTLLRAAGAIVFGKTTTAEFGWAAISDNPVTGRTRNPRNPAHSAGGSSCGAAAQIAAGWGPLALGTDAGGSVRIPASYCGLVGFKPTYGSIPQSPLSALGDYSHIGPLTRSVDDCERALSVLSAPDLRDQTSLYTRGPPARPARTLRIGWAARFAAEDVLDAAIEQAFHARIDGLRRDGYELVEVTERLSEIDALWPFWLSRNYESFATWPAARRGLLDPRLQQMFDAARGLEMATLANSRIVLRDLAFRLTALFRDVDILLSPTTPTVAPLAGDLVTQDHPHREAINASLNWFPANPYCYPFNMTQQPALNLPLGCDADGLPFGLQIIGRKYRDGDVVALAHAIEAN